MKYVRSKKRTQSSYNQHGRPLALRRVAPARIITHRGRCHAVIAPCELSSELCSGDNAWGDIGRYVAERLQGIKERGGLASMTPADDTGNTYRRG